MSNQSTLHALLRKKLGIAPGGKSVMVGVIEMTVIAASGYSLTNLGAGSSHSQKIERINFLNVSRSELFK